MTPATINFPDSLVRGDTLNPFFVDFAIDGTPLGITSARARLITLSRDPVFEWAPSISGGRVTMPAVSSSETAIWPVGVLDYGVELLLSTGLTITPVVGALTVLSDPVP